MIALKRKERKRIAEAVKKKKEKSCISNSGVTRVSTPLLRRKGGDN